jgi:peptidoglycan hydrolase-like protein with peptidoglycan-binding domain
MVTPEVSMLQKNLAFLGYKISEKEFKTQTFGRTTQKAIMALQKEHNLKQTGQYDRPVLKLVSKMIKTSGTNADLSHRYRIRGSVRNELWEPENNMVIKIYELILDKESPEPLAAMKNHLNSFFDVAYDAPVNPVTGGAKDNFHLVIKLFSAADQNNPLAVQKHFNVNPIHWVNFTKSRKADGSSDYNGKYLGKSLYEVTGNILQKASGTRQIEDLKETSGDRQVTQLSLQTGLSTDEIMHHVLSCIISKDVKVPALTPEVFYAFLSQNLPSDLPEDLLRSAGEWESIRPLIELASSGIAFLDDSIVQQAIDNAVSLNIVSQQIKINRNSVTNALSALKTAFALSKPILVGNGNLSSILKETKIDPVNYIKIAGAFIDNKGINTGFWADVKLLEGQIGAEGITDFIETVESANISLNHIPTIKYLKNNTGPGKKFKRPSDVAKLDKEGIKKMIKENGRQVPDNMPGENETEKIENFASTIMQRSEFLYPAVSLVAATKRRNAAAVANIDEVEKFIDEEKEFKISEQNVDAYLRDKNISVDPATRSSLKLVQRIHKLTPDPVAGSVLLEKKLHSSMQIYFSGKERIASLLKENGVDDKNVYKLYQSSRMQYMAVLARITDFRREFYRGTPAAIVSHVYSEDEVKQSIGDIPDLETLFGSLDFCECEHCKSLYGPAAYLADMLRFLKEHLSTDPSKTVKDILFERRPDLGNIRLNCENTNTALPYIDLVCEILENNLTGNKNFVYQTTLTQKELRAMPENIQPAAYTRLAGEEFPMSFSFNLWQEEARAYLGYLRVPRWELMEAFQNKTGSPKVPDDSTIAAEFFEISTKEKDLIITERPDAVNQTRFWGFDANQSRVGVSLFMKRSGLSYYEIMELLAVNFVNGSSVNKSSIERTVETCDTDAQTINNLTPAKLDLMHRFIRLWRKTGWKMWELDLLLRNDRIGKNRIAEDTQNDVHTLTELKNFKQLQEMLKLPFSTLLAFYGNINREIRIKPETQDVIIQPLYNTLFQNVSVTNPVDPKFRAIGNLNDKLQPVNASLPFNLLTLDSNILLKLNADGYNPVPTILSALAIRQTEFDILAGKTNNHLSLESLSILFRYVYLSRGLKLSIPDLILFLSVTNTNDPFASPKDTISCIENLRQIRSSGLSLSELDYILNYRPDSAAGLRDETIVQLLEGLRRILEETRIRINSLNSLISFDADALDHVNNADAFILSFSKFQSDLITAKIDMSASDIKPAEIKFINDFNKLKLVLPDGSAAPNATSDRSTLISNIKKVQVGAGKVLADTVIQKKNQIKSFIASSFSISSEQSDILLTKLTLPPSTKSLLADLENENLIALNNAGELTEINRINFGSHFGIMTLLHKSSLLVSRMKTEPEDLDYFIANKASVSTPDLSSLPVNTAVNPNQFAGWLNLHLFLEFRKRFPEPENVSIRSILDLAKDSATDPARIRKEISALTKWDEGDISHGNLTALETGLGIRHTSANKDYTLASTYLGLLKCFEQMKLTGADAQKMLYWRLIDSDLTRDMLVAQQTRHAVKSKYEQEDWLSSITPLQDEIRERKRKALVGFHIDYSQRSGGNLTFGTLTIPNPGWTDTSSLFKYFLIDVEMSSCQLTSRIKQAISSVQLFVQRCFLNLESKYVIVTQDEKEDVSSPNAWSQWRWKKSYRLWEAARKIFFYPQNWLEPELRDDKSPFFKELENDLTQNEVTKENAETAFLNYLHKVDEVSHLEVCGLYHQMEDQDPDEAGYEKNIVHVIGRTKAIPHIYYYRTYDMNYSLWSAWEKIDVDITGDHITPVIYNRKLHLFWLQFMEKPMKTKKIPAAQTTSGPTDAPEPLKVMEVQLGWTVKKSGGWSTKKISKQKLIHPWERPYFSYNLKPYYLSKFNELYLDIYLSTSAEFNNSKFYDPNKPLFPFSIFGYQQNPTFLTKNRFNEDYLPWHSSSFVFDGEVTDLKLKGLGGSYINSNSFSSTITWNDDSYDYVHGNFGESGEAIKELEPIEFGPRLKLPHGMHFNYTHLTNNRIHSANGSNLRVLENSASKDLLNKAISPFELVITQQDLQLNTMTYDHPAFYQDSKRSFFIKPEWETRLNNSGQVIGQNRKYRFMPFYHPYTTLFIRELNRGGLDHLLNRRIQTQPQDFEPKNNHNFNNYAPVSSVIADDTAKTDTADFSFGGAYSLYNWELFFHAPLMIACRLMQNQKFEDAMNWFHYIFNPTNIEGTKSPQRYWVTKPFFEYNSDNYRNQRIESILSNLNLSVNSDQLRAWSNKPFSPHVIARYRPVAYQENVVMKYLDNLIAWGDMQFKRDTLESINEASLLYMLAYEILGERPRKVPTIKHEEFTFNQLEAKLDQLGNARVDAIVEDTLLPVKVISSEPGSDPVPKLDMFYFCIPNNDFITKYWDTVEDRLYKIRHCMNIAGIVRQLPLFEPPIDPALLVKAAAAGIDLSSVLNDVAAPVPYYRFRIVLQKAIDFCNEVVKLGDKLLSVLEKKDVEVLSLMRSQHEIMLLDAVKEVRRKQIDEARETIRSLSESKNSAEEKKQYYESREFMNLAEIAAMTLSGISTALDAAIATGYIISGGLKLIPDFMGGVSGFGGSPQVDATFGGQQIGNAGEMAARTLQSIAAALDKGASISTTVGSYMRRKDDWDLQGRLATFEKDQIQYQINAAEIRQAIAEKELENTELQIENAKVLDDYMRNKYTNDQLYNWMIGQVSGTYFQAYQMAFDMAKKAEKCLMYELGITDSNIIQFGYWDSLKKGLLSGDKLMNDLKRLEVEYFDQNRREFEITKHISLAQINPLSLIALKQNGLCTISLPEWLFDMDYPGHYMRRIKNVAISIPCVVGPYTGINCTLSLLRNETRMAATLNNGAYSKVDESDTRFRSMFGSISSIATSHAQNDNGMFELNFNDDRYLPFEGAGIISEWQISLPKENNYFDFATISDVILHISYTSRGGGGQLSIAATTDVKDKMPDSTAKLFSL